MTITATVPFDADTFTTSQPMPTPTVWAVEIEFDYGTVIPVGPFDSRYDALAYYCTVAMLEGVTQCETVKYTFFTRAAADSFAATLAGPVN